MTSIYPKHLCRGHVPVAKRTVFALMPFADEFTAVYGELKEALARIGYDCSRSDELSPTGAILSTIIYRIRASEIVIADLSGKNANVFYEVGVAHVARDMPHIVLISQDVESLPFDLRHLYVIPYSLKNLKKLAVDVQHRIRATETYLGGRSKLFDRYHFLLGSGEDFDQMVELLDQHESQLWRLLAINFGLEERSRLPDSEIELSFAHFEALLRDVSNDPSRPIFRNAYHIFLDVLVSLLGVPSIRQRAVLWLQTGRIDHLDVPEHVMAGLVIDLAIALYKHPEYRDQSLRWILDYLRRDKVGGIDLNRAKIESFILTSRDHGLISALLSAVAGTSDHLKEVAVDALGELRFLEAIPNLCFALEGETNPYIARSIFSALGKMQARDAGPVILRWFEQQKSWVADGRFDFLFGYAMRALQTVDGRHGTNFAQALERLSTELTDPKKANTRRPRKLRKNG